MPRAVPAGSGGDATSGRVTFQEVPVVTRVQPPAPAEPWGTTIADFVPSDMIWVDWERPDPMPDGSTYTATITTGTISDWSDWRDWERLPLQSPVTEEAEFDNLVEAVEWLEDNAPWMDGPWPEFAMPGEAFERQLFRDEVQCGFSWSGPDPERPETSLEDCPGGTIRSAWWPEALPDWLGWQTERVRFWCFAADGRRWDARSAVTDGGSGWWPTKDDERPQIGERVVIWQHPGPDLSAAALAYGVIVEGPVEGRPDSVPKGRFNAECEGYDTWVEVAYLVPDDWPIIYDTDTAASLDGLWAPQLPDGNIFLVDPFTFHSVEESFGSLGQLQLRRLDDPDAVARAITEFDGIGLNGFLRKYGLLSGEKFFLQVDAGRYDVRQIAAAAFGFEHPRLGPIRDWEFPEADNAAAAKLEDLGFEVVKVGERRHAWVTDELLLALDLYLTRGGPLNDADHDVIDLSELLNSRAMQTLRTASEKFRSPEDVASKLRDFAALDATNPHVSTESNGQHDREVWARYHDKQDELHRIADEIRSLVTAGSLLGQESGEEEVEEGRLLFRTHRARERNRKLVQEKKAATLSETGTLACEACGFDFVATYGELGLGFIECHHTVPLSHSGPTTTTTADLALLCSNCHRMAHRKKHGFATVDELRAIVNDNRT